MTNGITDIMTIPVWIALLMAIIDVIVFSLLKLKWKGSIQTQWVFVFAFILYGCQAIIYYKALNFTNLINANLLWNVISTILVTLIGLYFFRETVTGYQQIGIILGIISVFLLR